MLSDEFVYVECDVSWVLKDGMSYYCEHIKNKMHQITYGHLIVPSVMIYSKLHCSLQSILHVAFFSIDFQ
jgi:hypothetical protein